MSGNRSLIDFGSAAVDRIPTDTVAPVVAELQDRGADPDAMMLVGAVCRDVLHAGSGQHSVLRRTGDLDLAIAVGDMATYRRVVASLDGPGSGSDYRYVVASRPVDLVPFGGVESPEGVGPARENLLGFQQVFDRAHRVALASSSVSLRVPLSRGTSRSSCRHGPVVGMRRTPRT